MTICFAHTQSQREFTRNAELTLRKAGEQSMAMVASVTAQGGFDPFFRDYRDHDEGGNRVGLPAAEECSSRRPAA